MTSIFSLLYRKEKKEKILFWKDCVSATDEPLWHSFEMISKTEINNNLYLLIHTVTIFEENLVVQAQFFHTFTKVFPRNIKLIGRRMRYRPRRTTTSKQKLFEKPTLKGIFKKKTPKIKHHVRTIPLYVVYFENYVSITIT